MGSCRLGSRPRGAAVAGVLHRARCCCCWSGRICWPGWLLCRSRGPSASCCLWCWPRVCGLRRCRRRRCGHCLHGSLQLLLPLPGRLDLRLLRLLGLLRLLLPLLGLLRRLLLPLLGIPRLRLFAACRRWAQGGQQQHGPICCGRGGRLLKPKLLPHAVALQPLPIIAGLHPELILQADGWAGQWHQQGGGASTTTPRSSKAGVGHACRWATPGKSGCARRRPQGWGQARRTFASASEGSRPAPSKEASSMEMCGPTWRPVSAASSSSISISLHRKGMLAGMKASFFSSFLLFFLITRARAWAGTAARHVLRGRRPAARGMQRGAALAPATHTSDRLRLPAAASAPNVGWKAPS